MFMNDKFFDDNDNQELNHNFDRLVNSRGFKGRISPEIERMLKKKMSCNYKMTPLKS